MHHLQFIRNRKKLKSCKNESDDPCKQNRNCTTVGKAIRTQIILGELASKLDHSWMELEFGPFVHRNAIRIPLSNVRLPTRGNRFLTHFHILCTDDQTTFSFSHSFSVHFNCWCVWVDVFFFIKKKLKKVK